MSIRRVHPRPGSRRGPVSAQSLPHRLSDVSSRQGFQEGPGLASRPCAQRQLDCKCRERAPRNGLPLARPELHLIANVAHLRSEVLPRKRTYRHLRPLPQRDLPQPASWGHTVIVTFDKRPAPAPPLPDSPSPLVSPRASTQYRPPATSPSTQQLGHPLDSSSPDPASPWPHPPRAAGAVTFSRSGPFASRLKLYGASSTAASAPGVLPVPLLRIWGKGHRQATAGAGDRLSILSPWFKLSPRKGMAPPATKFVPRQSHNLYNRGVEPLVDPVRKRLATESPTSPAIRWRVRHQNPVSGQYEYSPPPYGVEV